MSLAVISWLFDKHNKIQYEEKFNIIKILKTENKGRNEGDNSVNITGCPVQSQGFLIVKRDTPSTCLDMINMI